MIQRKILVLLLTSDGEILTPATASYWCTDMVISLDIYNNEVKHLS